MITENILTSLHRNISYHTGRWLVAALQTVQRNIVNSFPTENDENQKQLTKNTILIENNIIRCDEVPYRVEADTNLKNRKIVTQYDYSCVLSENDFRRVSGNSLLLEHSEAKKNVRNSNDNTDNNNDNNNNDKESKGYKNENRIKMKSGKSENSNHGNNDLKVTKKIDKSSIISLSNIKNKLSIIKNTVLQQISSQKIKIKTRFVWFDYHKKCKNGNIASLKEIFPTVKDAIFGVGGFYSFQNVKSPRSILQKDKKNKKNNENLIANNKKSDFLITNVQKNIVRTNCIDCLDRTNVVQTTIGRWALNNQLRMLGAVMGEVEKEGVWDTMSLPDDVRTVPYGFKLSVLFYHVSYIILNTYLDIK